MKKILFTVVAAAIAELVEALVAKITGEHPRAN